MLRSVGYKGVAAAGRPVRRATRDDPERRAAASTGAERTYAAGWIKRGPSGVIGTNKKDATETVERCSRTRAPGRLSRARADSHTDARGAAGRAAASSYVEYAGWQAIDAAERRAGEPLGRPRVKLHTWEKLLHTARKHRSPIT